MNLVLFFTVLFVGFCVCFGIGTETEIGTAIEIDSTELINASDMKNSVTEQNDNSRMNNSTHTMLRGREGSSSSSRRLSASVDLITKETVRTYNGNVPFVTCAIGYVYVIII